MSSRAIDYFNLAAFLTPDEIQVWQMARKFVDTEWLGVKRGGKSLAVECTRAHRFPRELIKPMADLGFLGSTLPLEFGGAGIGPVAYGLINYELERGDSALRSFASVTGGLVCYNLFAYGSDEQKSLWLPKLCRGEAIGCYGLTESGGGSNPAGQMRTTAIRDGDGFVLNGEKQWITNSTMADIAIVWAKLDGEVRAFLVEKGTLGFAAVPVEGKLSLVCSDSGNLVLTDCRVPEKNMLPHAVGIKSALSCLNEARYGIVWGAVGAASACYEDALRYVLGRTVFPPKPVAGYQLTQMKLARMLAGITYAQLACVQLGRLKEKGLLRHEQLSLAKQANVSMAQDVARTARGMLGAAGITDEYSPMRHLINLETVATYEGTDDIHTLIVGRDITGINALS